MSPEVMRFYVPVFVRTRRSERAGIFSLSCS